MNDLLKKLHALANRWEQTAMKQVPPEYAGRSLHDKYLRLDNEAAGLSNCAEELRELLNIEAAQQSVQSDCDHEWVSGDNEVVSNCLICRKCLAVTAANANR